MMIGHSFWRRAGLYVTRSNCFFFSRWILRVPGWRRDETKGYLSQRRTIHWKLFNMRIGWHWLYVIPRRNGRFWMVHYDPIEPFTPDPNAGKWKQFCIFAVAAFHKILFKGTIKRYDPEYHIRGADRRHLKRIGKDCKKEDRRKTVMATLIEVE